MMVGTMPSREKRSSAQNSTRSNSRLPAPSNSAANCLRLSEPFRPLSWSMYSPTISWPAWWHHSRNCISWFCGSWPLSSVLTLA
jgi:hypothetical protein